MSDFSTDPNRARAGAGEPGDAAPTVDNRPLFSVSEISQAVKRTLEGSFEWVRVRGEISGFKRAASGHLYMSLKDENAVLDAVCWRGGVYGQPLLGGGSKLGLPQQNVISSAFKANHVRCRGQEHLHEKADRLEAVAYGSNGPWAVDDIAPDDGFEVLRFPSAYFEYGVGRRADSKSVSPIIFGVVTKLGRSEVCNTLSIERLQEQLVGYVSVLDPSAQDFRESFRYVLRR